MKVIIIAKFAKIELGGIVFHELHLFVSFAWFIISYLSVNMCAYDQHIIIYDC